MAKHSALKATRYAAKTAEKAITRLGRWATTDHTGTAKLLANLPPMAFIDTLSFVLIYSLCSILGAVTTGLMVYVLLAHGIPLLLGV